MKAISGKEEEKMIMKEEHCEWLNAFQQYCDSDEIRKESEMNGINSCGYGIQCNYCDLDFEHNCCARAMVEYCEKKNIEIDYSNMTKEYFRKLLLHWQEKVNK